MKNTWTTKGMFSEWREKCPLHRVERYLYSEFKKFPSIDSMSQKELNARTPEHVYWQDAWELIYHLEELLFCCSSAIGNPEHVPFKGHLCQWPGCKEPATSLRNQKHCGKNEDDWVWLDDAPQFHCSAHHSEAHYGVKYVAPTLEEERRNIAFFMAMERMRKEKPPESLKLECGLKIDSFTMVNFEYFKRLAEIAEEEYQKLLDKPN